MNLKFTSLILSMLFFSALSRSQSLAQNITTGNDVSWALKWEASKAFIENKGQFNGRNELSGSKILYGVDQSATQIYFTKSGMTFRFDEHKRNKDRRKGDASKPKYITESDFVHLAWEGADTAATLMAGEKRNDYHSYAFFENGKEKNINHINGYGKLIYRDLYPGIDVEYVFHPDNGIKYTLILHPGADISKVKMKYSKQPELLNGEIYLPSGFGNIVDHAPVAFYADNHSDLIASGFVKNKKTISFALGNYDHSRTIIIDPWVQTPTLANSNGVWECERDGAGNVYIIGGDMPMKLLKYNSAGVIQWTYSTPWDTTNNWLGTLATDLAGNSYITSGSTAAMQKVDASGAMTWSVSGGAMDEYWTISFNCDQTKLIVGGTRLVGFPSPNGDGVIFDINTSNGSVNTLKTVGKSRTNVIFGIPVTDVEEVRAMSPSRNAKYYFVTLDTLGAIDQNLSTCPSGSLFGINHTYAFGYKSENYRPNNGNSGIKAVKANGNFVYTQNGTTVHKRSLTTGAILATATITGGLNTSSQGLNQPGNNGIDIDSCGNVYVGSGNAVIKYDANLNLITSAATSFAVFDVAVSYNGDVVVCGATGTSSSASRTGYVQSFSMSSCNPLELFCCDATVCPAGPVCASTSPFALTPAVSGGTFSGPGITNASSGTFDPSVAGAGTHTVVYSQSCGSDSITITVNPCVALTACQDNGNVTATSGSGPYTWYEWDPGGQTQITTQAECTACNSSYTWFGSSCLNGFTPVTTCNTPAGWSQFATGTTATPATFPVLMIDSNGDSLQISSISSLPNCTACTPPAASTSSTSTTCGQNNGTATVSATGGSTPYTYSWSNGQTTQSISGLAAGTYTVTVTGGSCNDVDSVTVASSTGVTATTSSTDASCGTANGTATASPSGGSTPYTYLWSNSQATQTATGLAAGNYLVTVTDNAGCTITSTVTVSSTSGMTGTASANSTSCGNNNGTATATPSGGATPYTYLWNNSQTSQTITGLASGTYTVTMTDNNGCTVNASVTVNSSSGVAATASATNTSCGSNNGTATASQSGGNSPYSYQWSNGQTTAAITGLAAGNYAVTITDNNNCTDTASATVSSSSGLSASTNTNAASCGSSDGSAIVTPSGGSSPYTFLWSNGQSTATATGLAPGNYSVTVTDNTSCTFVASATVSSSGGPAATASATAATCNGTGTGSATVSPSGGTSPYTYLWNNGQTGLTATGLSAGNYTVTVTDAGGCTATANATVSQPPAISAATSVVDAACGASNGSATVSVSGGSTPYSYVWDNGQTSPAATGLAAGSYSVTITDAGNCTQTATATVGNPNAPTATTSSSDPSCNGGNNGTASVTASGGTTPYTYNWSTTPAQVTANATGLSSGTYTVTISDFAGCSAVSAVTIGNPAPVAAQITSNDTVVCSGNSASLFAFGGTNYIWSTGETTTSITVSNIISDTTILVTATDANGCAGTDTLEITAINASVTISGPNTLCPGQSGTLIASGGNTYQWNTAETNDTITVNPASDSTYSVYGTNSSGCSDSATIAINVSPGVEAVVSNDTTIGYGAIIQIAADGGDYFLWNTGETTQNITVSPEVNTSYMVTITDAYGCSDTAIINITVECRHAISIPNIFTPNGDGNNDFIRVHGYGIASLSVVIYDRWGEKIAEITDRSQAWDGTRKGKPLNSAVFVYILKATFCDGIEYEEKGNITLIR